MKTEKEITSLKKQLARVQKCGGNCKECKYLYIHTVSDKRGICYGFGCNAAPDISPYFESLQGLRDGLIETLKFEIS